MKRLTVELVAMTMLAACSSCSSMPTWLGGGANPQTPAGIAVFSAAVGKQAADIAEVAFRTLTASGAWQFSSYKHRGRIDALWIVDNYADPHRPTLAECESVLKFYEYDRLHHEEK